MTSVPTSAAAGFRQNSSSSSQMSAPIAGPGPSTALNRIRFPADGAHERNRTISSEGSSRYSSLGLGPPPVIRASRKVSPNSDKDNSRRRVRSVDATVPAMTGSPPFATQGSRRRLTGDGNVPASVVSSPGASPKRQKRTSRGLAVAVAAAAAAEHPGSGVSEEYDLYPRILEDVQRALRVKARREARLRNALSGTTLGQSTGPRSDGESAYAFSSQGSLSTSLPATSQLGTVSLPTTAITSPVSPPSQRVLQPPLVDIDVDFSPTVTAGPQHPVPTSFNDGATLDWSGVFSDDERSEKRGLLSLSKRKWKEKTKSTPGPVVEQSTSLYSDKLARIRQNAQPLTLKKATITADQLSRRYSIIYDGLASGKPSNPSSVLHWFGNESPLRTSLDQSEPMAWIKHLTDKRPKGTPRSPWHLTAAMAEEHQRATMARQDIMATIPENGVFTNVPRATVSPSPSSPLGRQSFASQQGSPVAGSGRHRSRPQSLLSIDLPASLGPRRRRSHEDLVSFEPSRRSPRASVGSLVHLEPAGGSPSSSRFRLPRFFPRRYGSDDGGAGDGGGSANSAQSSARNSVFGDQQIHSDQSEEMGSRHVSREASPAPNSDEGLEVGNNSMDGLITAKAARFPSTSQKSSASSAQKSKAGAELPQSLPRTDLPRRIMRRSFPSHPHLLPKEHQPLRTALDEEHEREAYENKAKLLEEAAAQNHRMRQVLQRVSANVKEFDAVQANFSKLLHVPYGGLPDELIEAFNHDPAAVTNHTRRLRGWEAVEDIHERIARQRDILHGYLRTAPSHVGIDPPKGRVFGDTVNKLLDTLSQLEQHKSLVASRASTVTKELAEVRQLQSSVKKQYNSTLSQVSAVYPELTQIVLLEENYKAQYQQLYDLGMDAITLFLDSFTPIWRRYGKKIGNDAVDFLLIPWYRNEWTGEPRRYPIAHFPRRSFQHWLVLLLIIAVDVGLVGGVGRLAMRTVRVFDMPAAAHPFLLLLLLPGYCGVVTVLWTVVVFGFIILAFIAAAIIWWLGWSIRLFS